MKRGKSVKVEKPVIQVQVEPAEPTVPDDGKIKWRHHGRGSFRMGSGRIIKPQQVFEAREDEIPLGFRDTIKPLKDLLAKEGKPVISSTEFEIVEHPVRNLQGIEKPEAPEYDVINKASGKAQNTTPYSISAAEKLLEDLS